MLNIYNLTKMKNICTSGYSVQSDLRINQKSAQSWSSPGSWTHLTRMFFAFRCNTTKKKKINLKLTLHLILRQANRGPVGEDIWNSAKSLVHEPGGHSTHWHFCEGKPTTVSRSSYSQALRSFLRQTLCYCPWYIQQTLKQIKGGKPLRKLQPSAFCLNILDNVGIWVESPFTGLRVKAKIQPVNRLWFKRIACYCNKSLCCIKLS